MEGIRTIQGYIVPLTLKGHDDMAAKVAVSAGDTEFHIVPRGAGADLAAHINAHVEVVGTVREKDGELLLQVRSYKLTDGYEHEWYDDDVE